MIWDLDMIREVRCARASVDIATELIVLPPEREAEVEAVLREAHRELAAGLADLVAPLAVHVRPEDVAMAEVGRRPNFGQVTLVAWWKPRVPDVELVGGPGDGQRLHWNRAPDKSVRIPVIGPVAVEEIGAGPPTGPPPELPARPATYSMTGWNESGWWRYGLEKQ